VVHESEISSSQARTPPTEVGGARACRVSRRRDTPDDSQWYRNSWTRSADAPHKQNTHKASMVAVNHCEFMATANLL